MKQENSKRTIEQRLGLLKRSTLLRQLSNTVLMRLLQLSEEQTCVTGQQLNVKNNVLLVLDGLLSVKRGTARTYSLERGDLLGLEEYLQGGPCDFEVRSIGDAQFLRIPLDQLDKLADGCAPWQQFLERQSYVFPLSKDPSPYGRAEVVAFENPVASITPRLHAVLRHLVAKEICQQFHETVRVLSGPESGFPPHGTSFIPDGTGVKCILGPDRPETSPGEEPPHDYVFLDLGDPSRKPGPIHKLVYLTDSKVLPGAVANTVAPSGTSNVLPATVLPTVLLNKGASPSGESLEGLPSGGGNDLGLAPCRTRFNWQLLKRLSPSEILHRQLDELGLDEQTRDSLSRWARAITCRRVGVGLGGGGAWGFYHVVLLRKLLEKGIPIDIISGASMGSLVAAAYSTRGICGLEQLVTLARCYGLSLMTLMSIATTKPIELLVDLMFGAPQLEDLLTIFHPSTTNLSEGCGVTLSDGPLGLAVRASSSAPGLFGPTVMAPNRYVDGCVSNNLPVSALIHAGADFTFASNCYPAAYRPYSPLIPGKLGAILSELNPVGRVQDLFVSANIALNSLGVQSAQLATVSYDPEPQRWPFWKSTLFHHVDEVIRIAEDDPKLEEAITKFNVRWESNARSVDVAAQVQEAA